MMSRRGEIETATICKTVWLEAPGKIDWREEPVWAPGPDQILCATVVSAISPGTELAAWQGLPPLTPQVMYPRLQGYCNVGRVLACGNNVTAFKPGDRVLSHMSHRSHYLLDPSDVLLKLSEQSRSDHVACCYLLHLGYDAVMRSNVRPGARVAVIGMGALGLSAVSMAHLAGADVCAFTDHDAPREKARAMGAKVVLKRDAESDLAQFWGGALADVVIITTNKWQDWQVALRLASKFGTIACLGFPGRGEALPSFNPLDSQYFYAKQLRLEAVGIAPACADERGFLRFNLRSNIAWIAQCVEGGMVDADVLISGRYPASEIATAYENLQARKNSPVTYILDWQP